MKLVEKEIVVINIYTKQIVMRFEYNNELFLKLFEITNNMNECAKLNEMTSTYYQVNIIYGVDYEDNKSK